MVYVHGDPWVFSKVRGLWASLNPGARTVPLGQRSCLSSLSSGCLEHWGHCTDWSLFFITSVRFGAVPVWFSLHRLP